MLSAICFYCVCTAYELVPQEQRGRAEAAGAALRTATAAHTTAQSRYQQLVRVGEVGSQAIGVRRSRIDTRLERVTRVTRLHRLQLTVRVCACVSDIPWLTRSWGYDRLVFIE